MATALIAAAARALAPMAMQAAGTFIQGKMGEKVGDRNLSEAESLRTRAASRNEDPTLQGGRSATATDNAQVGANNRSMGREAFLNQMTQANKRADNEDQRTTYDQDNAYRRGAQLADIYAQTAGRQAESNNNVLATMLGIGGTARR